MSDVQYYSNSKIIKERNCNLREANRAYMVAQGWRLPMGPLRLAARKYEKEREGRGVRVDGEEQRNDRSHADQPRPWGQREMAVVRYNDVHCCLGMVMMGWGGTRKMGNRLPVSNNKACSLCGSSSSIRYMSQESCRGT